MVLAISASTSLTSAGELHWSTNGMLLFFSSMYCEALRLILTQKLLTKHNLHALELLYHLAPASFLFTATAALAIEVPRYDERYIDLHMFYMHTHIYARYGSDICIYMCTIYTIHISK